MCSGFREAERQLGGGGLVPSFYDRYHFPEHGLGKQQLLDVPRVRKAPHRKYRAWLSLYGGVVGQTTTGMFSP